jgi:hypothetical protein
MIVRAAPSAVRQFPGMLSAPLGLSEGEFIAGWKR